MHKSPFFAFFLSKVSRLLPPIFITAFLFSACSPSQEISFTPLDVYVTKTLAVTQTPVIVIPPTPLPTSTPFVYTIQSGDTFSTLAEKFSVSQDALRAANPDVSPNAMPIGGTLLIPDGASSFGSASTPAPAPVPVTQTVCRPSANAGLWCFALIHNTTTNWIENVSAEIALMDANGSRIGELIASTPLDFIPPDGKMPVYAYFPNVPPNLTPQVTLLSAIETQLDNQRYLPATLSNTSLQINENELSAILSGEIHLPTESKSASRVLVAAVLYDQNGVVNGVRRWEGGAVQPGTGVSFSFLGYSISSGVEAAEFFVQAVP